MVLKKYQPGRADFLINTDWGIPHDCLTAEQARDNHLLLFHERWVTVEEIEQLRREYLSYRSVRVMGSVLMALSLIVFINIVEITKGSSTTSFFTVIYGVAMFICGIGLFRFARFAQKLAVLFFLSLFVLPFIPPLTDDKGAPFLIAYGAIGLYYVLRKSARKIFDPLSKDNSAQIKPKKPVVRKLLYSLMALIVLGITYIVYDMGQARQQALAACNSAQKGMSVNDFLAAFSEKDFKIIARPESVMLVPLRGMGRNHCTIMHDGVTIAGSKVEFSD